MSGRFLADVPEGTRILKLASELPPSEWGSRAILVQEPEKQPCWIHFDGHREYLTDPKPSAG